MMDVLMRIQHSELCQWILGTESVFGYYGILTLHTIGMGIVVSISACIELRVLGFAPGLSLAPLEQFFPLLWLGFWINALSGTILLATDATHKLVSLDFYLKMALIAVAVVTLRMVRKDIFRHDAIDTASLSTRVKALAFLSLVCWLGAIISGRLLPYVVPTGGPK
jgi:hypothetical protein